MSPYVDPDYVAEGFFESEGIAAPSLYLTEGTYATDFREYRRGRLPGDWSARWYATDDPIPRAYVEGAFVDAPHRSALRLQSSGVGNNRALYTWDTPDAAPGNVDSEILTLIRVLEVGSETQHARVHIRAAGTSPNLHSYQLLVGVDGNHALRKLVNDVPTVLTGGTFVKFIGLGAYIWIRLRANGSTISAKVWADGTAEPGAWDVTATDATHAGAGWSGLESFYADAVIECSYFAIGVNGATAPPPTILGNPMDVWIAEPDEEVELTAAAEYYDPDANGGTGGVETVWLSTHGRTTGPYDYPPSTTMRPLLIPSGTLTARLEADAHLGGVVMPTRQPLRFSNLPDDVDGAGPLDPWTGYSFHARPVEIRVGRRWLVAPSPAFPAGIVNPHRSFEIAGCAVAAQEPDVGVDEVALPLSPLTPAAGGPLAARLHAYRNVGIATGVRSITAFGWLSIPSSTAYAVTSWVVYLRAMIPTTGVPGTSVCNLSRRQTDSTHRQWHVALYQAGTAFAVANKIHFVAYAADGTNLISEITPTAWNVGRYVDIVFGVRGGVDWYAYVDGKEIGSGPLATNVDTCPGQIVEVLGGGATGVSVLDHRIEAWVPASEALARFSARRDPDTFTISMHRCDETSGATVTDYAPLANHGTLQGTNGVDRERVATYLGSPELAGTPMPISGGEVFHAPTQSIDPVREGFRYNDRARTAGTGVTIRAKGLPITGGGVGYSEPAGADGVVDFTGAADQPVTFATTSNVTPENERIHIPRLVRDEMLARTEASAATMDGESFLALRRTLPFRGGFYYPEPPTLGEFLGRMIGGSGAYASLDRDARIYASIMRDPINPGPSQWTESSDGSAAAYLEFLGYPNRGVVVPSHNSYSLMQTTSFSLTCWFKLTGPAVDTSTPTSFSVLPRGMTLIDRVDADASSGYYLGIDGRDGYAIFGVPGVTGSVTGFHYLKVPFTLRRDVWYCAQGVSVLGSRSIKVFDEFGASNGAFENTTFGGMTDALATPLRIGHGPRGSFVGAIAYAVGASGTHTGTWFNTWPTAPPVYGSEVGGENDTVDRFWVEMREGAGDLAIDTVTGNGGRIDGCRWSPRTTFDFGVSAGPEIAGVSRPIPLWWADVRYRLNYAQLAGANVAAGVSAADRIALAAASLSETDSSVDVRDAYLGSREVQVQSPLSQLADADYVSRVLRDRVSPARRFADAQGRYREDVLRLGLTDEVRVVHPRFTSVAGLPMRVATMITRLDDLMGDVGLWG